MVRGIRALGCIVAGVFVISLMMTLVMAYTGGPYAPVITATNISLNGVTTISIDFTGVPADFDHAVIHQIVVSFPAPPQTMTEKYMLGTASAPGIVGDEIVCGKEVITLKYGPAAGISPYPIDIKGKTYYWWRIRKGGNPVYPNEEISAVPNPGPTSFAGTYEVDVEGISYYNGQSGSFFKAAWFDVPGHFNTPEFGITMAAMSLAGYMIISFKNKKKAKLN